MKSSNLKFNKSLTIIISSILFILMSSCSALEDILNQDKQPESKKEEPTVSAPPKPSTPKPEPIKYETIRVTFLGLGMHSGWHNDDCTRIGNTIKIVMQEVDRNGNIKKSFLGIPETGNKGKVITVSKQTENQGYKNGGYVYHKRKGQILTHLKLEYDKLNARNLGNQKQTSVEFNVDQKALNENRLVLKIMSDVKSCHKWNNVSSDFTCNLKTQNGEYTTYKKVKYLLKNKSKVEFGAGKIPTVNDRWGDHKWEPFFRIEKY